MKIALLTIWHEKNYGAELQTYATVKALKSLGHQVEVVNYLLGYNESPTIKQRGIAMLTFFTKQDWKFRRFWKRHIPAGRFYHSLDELKRNPPIADLYLVGSDQVWNPLITKEKASAYFLDFGDKDARRASYASSFGSDEWKGDAALTEIARQRLKQMEAVSCREQSGVKLLNDVFGVDAVNVLDPTLLHKSYPELTGEIIETNTLAFYPLSGYPGLESFCRELASLQGLEFVNVNKKTYMIRRIAWDRPGVEEWVKSIAGARLVVTPSFHGLAFSLIYHRQFVVVQNENGGAVSTRIKSLLNLLGLEDRFFTSIDQLRHSDILSKEIDYEAVDARLERLRKESNDYLRKLLT